MKLPSLRVPARWRRVSRGQALVEFALVLPILVLLLVMAIDFGRVFYGWVALNNAARVGANYAALHADAWYGADNASKQAERADYLDQIVRDAQGINCTPQPSTSNIGDPEFTLADGTTPVTGTPVLGNQARVTLSCTMSLITPLASGILGGGVPLGADSVFTVRSGAIEGVPVTGSIPTPTATPSPSPTPTATPTSGPTGTPTPVPTPTATPCPLPIANFVANPTKAKNPITVQFTDTSQTFGCQVTGWLWDFGDGAQSTLQHPSHKYTGKGTYSVRLTVFSQTGNDSLFQSGYITSE